MYLLPNYYFRVTNHLVIQRISRLYAVQNLTFLLFRRGRDDGNGFVIIGIQRLVFRFDDLHKYLRLSAEFDNYRKRTMKEKAELILNGGEKSISSILPIVDDFERALKNMETATDVAAVKEGVELIYNKFMSVLGQNGVKVIETKEQPLDTDYHEAIAVIPAPNEALKGKILDCVQTGYILNDKVIRHAKVVVGE